MKLRCQSQYFDKGNFYQKKSRGKLLSKGEKFKDTLNIPQKVSVMPDIAFRTQMKLRVLINSNVKNAYYLYIT